MRIHDPVYLIINTSAAVHYLNGVCRRLKNFDADKNKILRLLIDDLEYKQDGSEELEYDCMAIIYEAVGYSHEHDIEILTDAIIKAGKIIVDELTYLKAYKNDQLPYSYFGLLGDDVILIRR